MCWINQAVMEWVSGPPAVTSWQSRQAPDEPDPWLGSGSRKALRTHQRLRNCLSSTKVVTQTKKKCFCHHSLARVALILHLKTANVSTRPLGCRCCIISTSLELPNDSEGKSVRLDYKRLNGLPCETLMY
nr:uncharacterized protein LOC128703459 [Cherax quadricarinatus]XP_053654087.1 uncharacterized protein LOC128703459 [Cherax quadricarinatus]